jgi:hypothetical protein
VTAPLQYGSPVPADPTAVMGRRTLAWIADLALFIAVVAAGFASMAEYADIPAGVLDEDACDLFEDQNPDAADGCIAYDGQIFLLDASEASTQTVLSLAWFAFFVLLQGLTGGSPGKLLFGLRVVDQYGNRCGIGRSLARTLMWAIDSAPWIVPLIGPITAFTSTGHRRVGDLAAGTYVVASSAVGSPVMAAVAAPPPGATPWGAPPPGWGAPPGAGPPPSAPSTPSSWSEPSSPPGASPSPPPAEPASTTTGPTAEPSPFVAPGSDVPGADAPSTAGPPSPPVGAAPRYELPPPQWDAARGTYLQWEPNQRLWLEWDTALQRWKPIDT